MSEASSQRRQRLIGIALMCAAVAMFACLDTTAKYLNTQMDSLEIAWARYTSAFLLTFLVSNPWTQPGLMRTEHRLGGRDAEVNQNEWVVVDRQNSTALLASLGSWSGDDLRKAYARKDEFGEEDSTP